MKKKILAIGAYERDNFGDLLFFQVLKESLKEHELIAGSIMYADMQNTLGEKTLPYTILLERYRWDAVWVVGGEVGGVDLDMAYGMSLSAAQLRAYSELSTVKRKIVQRALSGSILPDTAYLPELDRFPLNREVPLIINSVGVSNIGKMTDRRLASRFRGVLKRATSLAVRDHRSVAYCKRNGIPTKLVPDVVHSIAYYDRWKRLQRSDKKSDGYIAFQINQSLTKESTREYIASILAQIVQSHKIKVVFIAAGTAVHHDSYADYEIIKNHAEKKIGRGIISILHSRNPDDIVECIINSELWIGTSLHGRIVAASFDTPRISLTNEKVHAYATTWDSQYPANVNLKLLSTKVDQVLSDGFRAKIDSTQSKEVTAKAVEHLEHLRKGI